MVMALAMTVAMAGPRGGVRLVHAQTSFAPTGQGFVLDAGDLRFIYEQILVAQDHAAGGTLLGPGPNQVVDPQLPRGLRTVDGSFNNLVTTPDQHMFGAADRTFPRLTAARFRPAENGTSYALKSGDVIDSQPRLISNLIVDQTAANPAAVAAAANPCGSGGFVCSGASDPDPASGALFIPNITPDFGLSAPFNLMFTFFGQFFDHGLDLVTKSGRENVIMPLQQDDPLFVPGGPRNFMVMARGQNQPGPDRVLGTADDVQETTNTTTPWVDQNQTYTSHPSHQVFLREYAMVEGKPAQTGKVLDGGMCAPRPTGIPGDLICNIGNWGEAKAQAATHLGIRLTDADVYNVPLLLTDPYGHFKPGPNGFPQLVLPGNGLLEGNPAANGGEGIDIPVDAIRTGHAFLDDIAHNAVPRPGLVPDQDAVANPIETRPLPGTYDDELLDAHFVTGDGRGNENIALTMVHNLFHAEHNRLAFYIDQRIEQVLTPEEVDAWHSVHPGSGWDYGERLFQAARFVTEMEYQHLVFEEFARKVQPLINPFLGGLTSIDAAITAEFAHTVYRLGHSMLPEMLGRTNVDGTANDIRLLNAFLNPLEYNNGGSLGALTADKAAGALIRGLSQQVGNELDEFVTESVRNTLLGLPLDLPAINIARGRSEGIPPLNDVRRQFFEATRDAALMPYANWFEFGLALRHFDSLVNFIAAYGTHPSIAAATTVAQKRVAAKVLVDTNDPFLSAPASVSGLEEVDFWVGGLAEKPAVFGGLLGPTFNFVFETQLERLQDGDRFYYLQRTDGLNLKTQLEGNSLAELARRNSNAQATMDVIFDTADFIFDAASLTGSSTVDVGDGMSVLTLTDGTKVFFDPLHSGKNIVFNGGPGTDRFRADVGDDSLYGNGGADRLDGYEGNDTLLGGDGDDSLYGGNGDDVLKGGPGHDAMQSGPGFGADLLLGADGNDFMAGGDDGVEYFAGPGNDIIVDGSMRSEAIVGGTGDDWLYDGDGHDGGMFGDDGNIFDLLAGVSPIGGDDVMGGGPGQDNHFGEGGDDAFVMSEGTNKFFGDFGFDWVTQRGSPAPANIELDLLAQPGVIINFNDLRNLYRFVDGASGWDLNDVIRGDNNLADPAAALERQLQPGMELTAAGAAKVAGLTDLLLNGFGKALPFMEGNILLGGRGSDILEGRAGDDLIDGDAWLNLQLEATLNDGTVKRVDSPKDLIDDVLSDPQRLNPGNIRIVRNIVSPVAPAADCGSTTPLNCDTAVFSGVMSDYQMLVNANGSITIVHVNAPARALANTGTDTLRNIERLQFADGVISAPGVPAPTSVVPTVSGLTVADAQARLVAAGLTVGATIGVNSTTVAAGLVIDSNPAAGSSVAPGTAVSLRVSLGALVPNVVNQTQAAAQTVIAAAGLTSTVTSASSSTVPRGSVITQTPAGGTSLPLGGTVALVVSSGPSGLVLRLTFNEANGTTAIDSSPSGRNGTITGAVRVPGKSGNALSFNGVSDWVTVIDGAAGTPLDLTTGMTIEAWVNPATLGGWNTVVLKERGIDALSYSLYANDGAPSSGGFAVPSGYVRANGADRAVRGLAELPTGAWTHLATTYDGIAQRIYINGAEVASRAQTGPIAVGNQPLRIGGNAAFAGGEFFSGAIDDVHVYSRALTAAEITLDMNGTSVPTTPPPPPPPPPPAPPAGDGLVLALAFDEASGTTAVDASPSGRHGAIAGALRVAGRFGGALSFGGISDWVTVFDGGVGSPLDASTAVTIEAWVNPASLGGWNTVLLKELGTNALSYALYANDGWPAPGGVAGPAGYVRVDAVEHPVRAGDIVPLDEWTHVATTFDGTTQRIYVNGVEVANQPQGGPIAVGDGPVRIGGNGAFAGGEFFQGLIDEVRIYNVARTAAQIQADMNTPITR